MLCPESGSARSFSAALTAPLPYTASKSRKPALSKDDDLPRTVLFDVTNEPESSGPGTEGTTKLKETADIGEEEISIAAAKQTPTSHQGNPSGRAEERTRSASTAHTIEPIEAHKGGKDAPAGEMASSTPATATIETFGSPITAHKEAHFEHKPAFDSPSDKDALERSMSSVSKVATWGTPSTAGSARDRSTGLQEVQGSSKLASRNDAIFFPRLQADLHESGSFDQISAPPPTPATATKSYRGSTFTLDILP